jgi:hypothetical protein
VKIAHKSRALQRETLDAIERANIVIAEYDAQGFTLMLRQPATDSLRAVHSEHGVLVETARQHRRRRATRRSNRLGRA